MNTPGSEAFDTNTPHSARIWNYLLGGKDNFAADREAGDAIVKRWRHIETSARESRGFLQRVVRYLAQEKGVRQFLDIGTGLPTADNTHEVAQSVDPACRVVYVDNDPLVLSHARALLTSTPEGATAYLPADLRYPQTFLTDPDLTTTLDLTQPVALMLVAVLHLFPDAANPKAVVDTLMGALPSGSFLVIAHGSFDLLPAKVVEEFTTGDYPGKGIFHSRTREQVGKFFDGYTLIEPDTANPGHDLAKPTLGLVSEWGRDPGDTPPPGRQVSAWGGVAVKAGLPLAGRR